MWSCRGIYDDCNFTALLLNPYCILARHFIPIVSSLGEDASLKAAGPLETPASINTTMRDVFSKKSKITLAYNKPNSQFRNRNLGPWSLIKALFNNVSTLTNLSWTALTALNEKEWICSLFKEWILEKSAIRVNLEWIWSEHLCYSLIWNDHRDHSGIPSDPWGHSKMSE